MKTTLKSLLICLALYSANSALFSMEEEIVLPTMPEQIQNPPSSFSFSSFAKKHWLPILGITTLSAYCVYDKQALSQAFSWSKNLWQTTPALFKGIGGFIGLGFACKTYNYLFNKPPLCNNPEHMNYVTREEFKPYKNLLDEELNEDASSEKFSQLKQEMLKLLSATNPKTQPPLAGGFGASFNQGN